MKKSFIFLSIFCFFATPAFAQQKQSGPEQLGTIAGVAMACGAHRQLYTYEEITSRLLSNTSANLQIEKDAITLYAQAKAKSYISQNRKPKVSCNEAVQTFSGMPIFRFQLYSDGSLKTPEGRFLFPRGQKKLNPSAELIYPTPAMPAQVPPVSYPPQYQQTPPPQQGYGTVYRPSYN